MVCFGGETIIDRSRLTELEFYISCKFIVYRRLEVCKNYDRVKVRINVRVLFLLGDSYLINFFTLLDSVEKSLPSMICKGYLKPS